MTTASHHHDWLQVIALVEHVFLLLHFVLPALISLMKSGTGKMDPVATPCHQPGWSWHYAPTFAPVVVIRRKDGFGELSLTKITRVVGSKGCRFHLNLGKIFQVRLRQTVLYMNSEQLEEISQWMAVGWGNLNQIGRLYMELDFDLLETTPEIPAVFAPIYFYGTQLRLTSLSVVCCSWRHFAFCWILFASQFRLKLWVTCSAVAWAQGIHVTRSFYFSASNEKGNARRAASQSPRSFWSHHLA